MLHYVAIATLAISFVSNGVLAQELTAQCDDLESGFRRILLEHGAVSLTLCIGPVEAMLGEHVFLADTLYGSVPSTKWAAQLFARRCRRGTRFCLSLPSTGIAGDESTQQPATLLRGAGFQLDTPADSTSTCNGLFDPQWEIPMRRSPARIAAPIPVRCAIIGAGIAGASVAHAMALRGWQVTVIDQEAAPARGASSLPAGLAVPHVSADDSPRSRITRRGIRLMAQHASRLLEKGQDWDPSGVLERRPDGSTRLHPHAAWVKPHRLVQAWLAREGITFVGNTKIATLQRSEGLWSLLDMQGQEIGKFEVVVVANAMGCATLLKNCDHMDQPSYADVLDKMRALQPIHGTLSHGRYQEAIPDLPAMPVNGNGCFIPHVPDGEGEQWCAGSTFEPDQLAAADLWGQHASNMGRLQHLLPANGHELAQTLDRGPISLWSSTRCVTHDRLPLVGPVGDDTHDGLWLCIGMGARGLSFAALCAELLVARLCAEPMPVEFSLSRSLDANRVRRKREGRDSTHPAG